MGQTLTHGVYLPDEGERNCYSGLAANWQILDNSVGTIAEHTTALSGKAPLVHTHTKSDITDFPAYGNAAGTICEGNDSRLSDARTPVAHTHGKADITDLFNSANTWTQSQAIKNTDYQIGEIPSAAKARYINFTDKNNVNIGWIQRRIESSGDSSIEIFIYNKFTNSQPDTAGTLDYAMLKVGLKADQTHFCEITGDTYPRTSNTYNLGTSTKKWKTLNGVNPGALSLPDYSNVVALDTTNWSKTGSMIAYTPTFDGWLQITIPNDDDDQGNKSNMIAVLDSGTSPIAGFSVSNVLGPRLYFLYPVRAGRVYWLYIRSYSETITTARLIKCMGNV